MNEQLEDEITSISSIYNNDTLERTDSVNICVLKLPSNPDISIRIEFNDDYPEIPPVILGTQSTGANVAKGAGQQLVDDLRIILVEIYTPGVPCIYDLIEEAGTRLSSSSNAPSADDEAQSAKASDDVGSVVSGEHESTSLLAYINPSWTMSEVITEKKSVFIARAAAVKSPQEAKDFVQHLLMIDKKVARATHNITAWRIQGDHGIQYQDCDDDGETAAGGRLLHLLELMDVWNVLVVVTRWYGGVLLGPDRFRLINQAARDAIVKSGLNSDNSAKKVKK